MHQSHRSAPFSAVIPNLYRSNSSHFSTHRQRRAKSFKHDTLLKWKTPPTNCLIVKKIGDEWVTHDLLDVALFLLTELKLSVFLQEATFCEIKEIAARKPVSCKNSKSSKSPKGLKSPKSSKRRKSKSKKESPDPKVMTQKCLALLSPRHSAHVHSQNDDIIGDNIHCVVVLGGDGTLLYLCSLFRDHQHVPPIVCFQRGSLGFLAPFQMKDYRETLTRILEADPEHWPAIAIRMRLTARIWRHPDNIQRDSVCRIDSMDQLFGQEMPDKPADITSAQSRHRSWSREVADHELETIAEKTLNNTKVTKPNIGHLPSIDSVEPHDDDLLAPLTPELEFDAASPSITDELESFTIRKDGDILFAKTQNIFPEHHCNDIIRHSLNEVLIHRDNNASMMTARLFIDGDECTCIQADGMIFSTPTGSTAYNISAGGSLISPTVPCIALTPICPHTLSFRPVVVPDETIIHIQIPKTARFNAVISFDGRNHITLKKGDVVEIIKCPYPVHTFKSKRFNVEWFQGLVSKFNWNLREMQKPFGDDSSSDEFEADENNEDLLESKENE